MKAYTRPILEFVELRIEERLARCSETPRPNLSALDSDVLMSIDCIEGIETDGVENEIMKQPVNPGDSPGLPGYCPS